MWRCVLSSETPGVCPTLQRRGFDGSLCIYIPSNGFSKQRRAYSLLGDILAVLDEIVFVLKWRGGGVFETGDFPK